VTPAERLAEAEARLEELEAERERLVTIVEDLVGVVERLTSAHVPAATAPTRPALRMIQGGGGS